MSGSLPAGALVAWKFRAALILGTVVSCDDAGGREMLTLQPLSKPASRVRRARSNVLAEAELNPGDVAAARRAGGHLARSRLASVQGPKATGMGVRSLTQLVPPGGARRARAERRAARLAADETAGAAGKGAGGAAGARGRGEAAVGARPRRRRAAGRR